jgi:predicted nucleic acid-binding protein
VRLVLDTNAVLDLWFFEDPPARALRAAIDGGRLEVRRSDACDAELAAVLARPRFAIGVAGERAPDRLLAHWRALAVASQPGAAPWRCTDADDQKFLDLAHGTGARVLVTKDRALLRIAQAARSSGLAIAPPAAVVLMLGLQDGFA